MTPEHKSEPSKRRKPRFWQKLSFKMTFGIVVILGFILILIGKVAIHEQRKYMVDQLNDYGHEMTEFVADISIVPIQKFSVYQLENFAARLEKGQFVTYCEIYDNQDNPLAHMPGKSNQNITNDPDKLLIFKQDIIDENEKIGWVELGINPVPVMTRMDKASFYIQCAFILELILIAFAVSFYVHRIFVSPFIRLTRITEDIAVGHFTSSRQAGRSDEIGGLAKSINSMSDKLKESYQYLERKVAERTGKLEESNEKLATTVDTLAQRNREISLFNKCIEELQVCETKEDTFTILFETCRQLFPHDSGTLTRIDHKKGVLAILDTWGSHAPSGNSTSTSLDDCYAVKNKKAHPCYHPGEDIVCTHNTGIETSAFCIPIIIHGDIFCSMHIVTDSHDVRSALSKQKLAENLIGQYALFLNNLQLRDTLRQQSVCDPLTGLFNRRFMEETLKREASRAVREEFSIGIIMVDVDHFKKFNDTYGHDMGDTILKKLAELLKSSIRKEDVVCRYGGEEFILIISNTSLDKTLVRAEKMRREIEKKLVLNLLDEEVKITVSSGVSMYDTTQESIDDVIKAADKALYISKAEGRNIIRSVLA